MQNIKLVWSREIHESCVLYDFFPEQGFLTGVGSTVARMFESLVQANDIIR